MRILVINGTSLSAAAAALVLKAAGHTVMSVRSVDDARPGRSTPVDIILLAPAHLDGLQGIDAQRVLRRLTPTPVVTIFDEPGVNEEERAVATTGGDFFLIWPVSQAELLETVKRVAHNRGIELFHVEKVYAASRSSPAATGGGPGYGRVEEVFDRLKA